MVSVTATRDGKRYNKIPQRDSIIKFSVTKHYIIYDTPKVDRVSVCASEYVRAE